VSSGRSTIIEKVGHRLRLAGAIRTLAEGGTCIEPVITERIMRALEKSDSACVTAHGRSCGRSTSA